MLQSPSLVKGRCGGAAGFVSGVGSRHYPTRFELHDARLGPTGVAPVDIRNRVAILIHPRRVVSWDHSKLVAPSPG
jgi:hypothetical protein